jgi:hypothetical protein
MGWLFDPVKKRKKNPANGQNQFDDPGRTASQRSKQCFDFLEPLVKV